MLGRDVVANIAIPKSRNYFSGGFTYTAIAKTPATRTTDAEWAVFRTEDATGHVDWAKNTAGINTNEFVFKGTEVVVTALSFTEVS